jgi:hypothetical protein
MTTLANRFDWPAPEKKQEPNGWEKFKAAIEAQERPQPRDNPFSNEAQEAMHKARGARSPLPGGVVKGWS